MKKILTIFSACALLTACGGEQKSEYDKYYESDYKADTAAASASIPEPKDNTRVDKAEATTDATANDAAADAKAAPGQALADDDKKGAKLISMSDCLTCHQDDQRVVGPSYVEVAKKYEFNDKNVDYLAGKIIKGGAGVWGQVPMTPHPDIKEEDAKEMARYVLSLRK